MQLTMNLGDQSGNSPCVWCGQQRCGCTVDSLCAKRKELIARLSLCASTTMAELRCTLAAQPHLCGPATSAARNRNAKQLVARTTKRPPKTAGKKPSSPRHGYLLWPEFPWEKCAVSARGTNQSRAAALNAKRTGAPYNEDGCEYTIRTPCTGAYDAYKYLSEWSSLAWVCFATTPQDSWLNRTGVWTYVPTPEVALALECIDVLL